MSVFDVDFEKLIRWLTPTRLRRELLRSWLQALAAPIVSLYGDFRALRSANLYQLKNTSTVAHLECVLNDRFDASLRRIYIADGTLNEICYINLDAEQQPQWLFTEAEDDPIWVYLEGETVLAGAHFIINVPAGIAIVEEMYALVRRYRLAGKRFTIIHF